MELTVTKGDTPYSGTINIPEKVDYNGRTFSVTKVGREAFRYSAIEKVKLSCSIKSIDYKAFAECGNLKEVLLNYGLKEITNLAFTRCPSLKNISIPSTVETIGRYAFQYDEFNKMILEDGNDKIEFLDEYAELSFSGTKIDYLYIGRTIHYYRRLGEDDYGPFYESEVGEVIIGPNVRSLPLNCFKSINNTRLTIPSGVEDIRIPSDNKIEVLNIEASGAELKFSRYFKDVKELSLRRNIYNVYVGNNLVYFFDECSKIKTLTIGDIVYDFSNIKFAKSDIETIYNHRMTPATINTELFSSRTYLYGTLYVPVGCLEAYKSAEGWKNFWNIKEMDFSGINDVQDEQDFDYEVDVDGIKSIGDNSFEIYSVDGHKVASCILADGEKLPLSPGFYIVRCGDKTQKVIIK